IPASCSSTRSAPPRCPTSSRERCRRASRRRPKVRPMHCPPTSTGARPRSTPAPTRCSGRSSPRPSSSSEGAVVDLELTDEQRMLADTVNGLLEKHYDANARLGLLRSDEGWSRDMWRRYAELGLLGLTFDEHYGGAGMGPDELAVVMDCFGRALILEPFLATVVLGGGLVAAAGTPEQKAAILPAVAAGRDAARVRVPGTGRTLVADRDQRSCAAQRGRVDGVRAEDRGCRRRCS